MDFQNFLIIQKKKGKEKKIIEKWRSKTTRVSNGRVKSSSRDEYTVLDITDRTETARARVKDTFNYKLSMYLEIKYKC